MKKTRGRIQIVDPDPQFRERVASLLQARGHTVDVVPEGAATLEAIGRFGPDLLLVDRDAAASGGLSVLRRTKGSHPEVLVVLLTREATADSAVEAFRAGAHDYLVKPVQEDELLHVVERGVHRRRLGEDRKRTAEDLRCEKEKNVQLLNELRGENAVQVFIGDSPSMRPIRDLLAEVTRTDSTVLITGESGTGKGVLARYIHFNSDRAKRPLVEANCAIYSEGVLQSELFGHEKGAFTGAVRQKRGRFELARGGTIFLDEIGDLSPGTQLMLLRVLQERKFERVGGEETIESDARVIAATNRDLAERMRREQFRADLYYRLNVIPIVVPPLRERREDIPALAQAILERCAERLGRDADRFSDAALQQLIDYAWPGNIRELENLIERTLILVKRPLIEAADLPLPKGNGDHGPAAATEWPSLQQHEREYIEKVLHRCGGNKKLAASMLGINRSSLYSKLKRLGIGTNGRNGAPPAGGPVLPPVGEGGGEPEWKS